MTSHRATDDFFCAECQRCVRGLSEPVFCAHSDEPFCESCCEREHGGAA